MAAHYNRRAIRSLPKTTDPKKVPDPRHAYTEFETEKELLTEEIRLNSLPAAARIANERDLKRLQRVSQYNMKPVYGKNIQVCQNKFIFMQNENVKRILRLVCLLQEGH